MKFRIRKAWGCIVGHGLPGHDTALHYRDGEHWARGDKPWEGSYEEALSLARTNWPSSSGVSWELVAVIEP